MQARILGVGRQRVAKGLGRGVGLAGRNGVPARTLEKRGPRVDLGRRRDDVRDQRDRHHRESDDKSSRNQGRRALDLFFGPEDTQR